MNTYQPTPRRSSSQTGLFATLLATLTGCAGTPEQAPDVTQKTQETSTSGNFDGLLSRKNPSSAIIGGTYGKETASGFARVNAFGYVSETPLLLNGKATLVGGEFARTQDAKYTQWGADVVGSALFDVKRLNSAAPEGYTLADEVIAFGPAVGISYVNGNSFIETQTIGSAGPRIVYLNGRVQAELEGRAIVHGDLEAKEGLSGTASGGLVNLRTSVDAGPVLPLGAHLVFIPSIGYTQLNRDLSGNVNGKNVDLTSNLQTINANAAVIADFGNWYGGLVGEAGNTRVEKDDSFTSYGGRVVGGVKLGKLGDLPLSLDAQVYTTNAAGNSDYGVSAGIRTNW